MKKYGILLVMLCFVVFQMTWSQSHKKSLPRPDEAICWHVIDDMPVYPGGTVALRQWMIDSVAPGLDSLKSSAEGKLLISFVVLENGACDSFKVVKSVAPEIDILFLNGLKRMRRWTPGKFNGKPMPVKFNLPITIKRERENEKNTVPKTKE